MMNWNLPEKLQWLSDNRPILLDLIKVLIFVLPVLMLVPGCIWWERRFLSWMQDRIGPNRCGTFSRNFPIKFLRGKGTFGLLQPIADGVKLFLKEDVTPSAIDRLIYFVAPAVALFPAFAIGGTLPWGPSTGPYGLLTPIWNAEIGIMYILAISSLGVYGVVLAGYASNNKYSLLGGLRSAAQLISYELAMSVSIASIVLAAGSLRINQIVGYQEGPLWGSVGPIQNWLIFTPYGFLSFIIFLICMVAETNRAPFDLPEAENEIIAGYHTEYSSMKFAVFFMGEYAAMFIFGGVLAAFFFGGYNMLPIRWEWLATQFPAGAPVFNQLSSLNYWLAPLLFLAKCATGISFFIWLRATLPRLRYDQLMGLGWKVLLPAAVGNFILTACWTMISKAYGSTFGWAVWGVGLAIIAAILLATNRRVSSKVNGLEKRTLEMSSGTEPIPTGSVEIA